MLSPLPSLQTNFDDSRQVNISGIVANVPSILSDCFTHIFSHALVEGIFRVSGSARRMKLITADYSQYSEWLENDEKKPNSHDIAGVIKKYLRRYLDLIDGLFSNSCLSQLQKLYLAQLRTKLDASSDSFKSANTSLASAHSLPSVSEDETAVPQVADLADSDAFLDSVAHLLITKNLLSKNELFLYLLQQLKELLRYEDQTKMSVANTLIIFQPYIFDTLNLLELQTFQDLLSLLVVNFDSFVQKYTCYKTILGGLEELDLDNVSVTSSEEMATSPLTVYSSHNGSPSKATGNSELRRKLISNRLSAFWDTYNLPANRSKRFSMNFGSKSTDRLQSAEYLAKKIPAVCPHQVLEGENLEVGYGPNLETPTVLHSYNASADNTPTQTAQDSIEGYIEKYPSPSSVLEKNFSILSVPENDARSHGVSELPARPALTKRTSSKRKSFIALFKSTLSVNSIPLAQQDELSPDSASNTPQTPPVSGTGASVDDLLLSETKIAEKKLFGRAFSMRLKRK